MEIKDSNGVVLQTGDSVQVIKDLKVGGSSMVLKRGDVVKNIKIVEDEEEVECRIGKATIMLKPEFLKKKG
ncbi:MAG: alkylphosphonate utilization protein [Candidatus Gracilibacteria bacterium]|jgi:protein PhnA